MKFIIRHLIRTSIVMLFVTGSIRVNPDVKGKAIDFSKSVLSALFEFKENISKEEFN